LILTFILVLVFALSCRGLLKSLTQPLSYVIRTEYSFQAQKIEKFYKISAWFLLTLMLFFAMVESFYDVFIQLPY
jgi:hypothetical protein